LYGGVSLAIYINGVMQEMLQLVRSTSGDRFLKTMEAPTWDKKAWGLVRIRSCSAPGRICCSFFGTRFDAAKLMSVIAKAAPQARRIGYERTLYR
jgi:hypothetical protein